MIVRKPILLPGGSFSPKRLPGFLFEKLEVVMRNFWSYVKIYWFTYCCSWAFHIFMVPSSLAAGGISGPAPVVNSSSFIKVESLC